MTRKPLLLLLLVALLPSCSHRGAWKLVWQDNFNGNKLNPNVWSRTERGTADWANTQSDDPRCLAVRNGKLVLRGIVNDDLTADTAHYLTGGVVTKGKHAFMGGRLEIKAKLQGARGAWPAIWLLPMDSKNNPWPDGGEIDIMERLNHDSIAYQTVHSYYTYTLRQDRNPPHGSTARINPDKYNVYGVEMYPDSVVFYINGKRDFCYPRINTDQRGQFPFYKPMYLLIDMQLGGSWVGRVHPEDLPVEMEVDWVKHYVKKE